MDLHKLRAGDHIQIGPLYGIRIWRYRCSPLTLLSWSRDLQWTSETKADAEPKIVRNRNPADWYHDEHGLYAFRTAQAFHAEFTPALLKLFLARHPRHWSESPFDGVVIGSVALWGVVVEHEFGYRGQYGRPIRFIKAQGAQSKTILPKLQRKFGGDYG